MLTVEEALALVIEQAKPLPPVDHALRDCRGCRLDEDVAADADQPPFTKSLVDGYAVRSDDLAGHDKRLKLGETILAGQMPTRPLEPGEAAAIMTGAPLPARADAVVMLEQTRTKAGEIEFEPGEVRSGSNVLERGRICRAGERILSAGALLGPASLGLLASVGRSRVRVVPRPRLAIVPTGDELVELDCVPGPGQIRNSNAVMLEALAIEHAAAAWVSPIAPDEPEELGRILKEGLAFDVLVVTGGVSAGQRDLVPAALEALGVQNIFHKIRLKPGKPLWFGVGPKRGSGGGTLVFGLPGNPVSGLVGFLLFIRPALHVLAGHPLAPLELEQVSLGKRFVHRGDRPTYHPARRVEPPADRAQSRVIETMDWAGSADLVGLAGADGFAVFPAGDRVFDPGEIVRFLPLR
jgi:molybdopterin molybdotransferase